MKEYLINKTSHVMRYHDLPGKGMPILFIHGLGCAGTFDYPEVAAQDSLKNHRCILVDLLGAGYSDKRLDFGERSLPDPDVQILAEDGIKIEMVKQAGHSMEWENPEGLASAISRGIQSAE